MLIKTLVLDQAAIPVFQGQTTVNALNLMEVAKFQEMRVREKGAKWVADGIPVFGEALIRMMRAGEIGEPMDQAAIKLAMWAWLHESIYGALDAKTFIQCDLQFTMLHDGSVRYDRVVREETDI